MLSNIYKILLIISFAISLFSNISYANTINSKAIAELPPCNIENSSYPSLSQDKAYDMSFIPGYSGSWNAGFNWKGLSYQPAKVLGAVFIAIGIGIWIILPFEKGDIGYKSRGFGYGCMSAGFGALLYVPFSIFDAEYSSDFIMKYNSKCNVNSTNRENYNKSTSFSPFVIYSNSNKSNDLKVDGLGFLIIYSLNI